MLEQIGQPDENGITPAEPVVIKTCVGCLCSFTGPGFPTFLSLVASGFDGEFCTDECRESCQIYSEEIISLMPDAA